MAENTPQLLEAINRALSAVSLPAASTLDGTVPRHVAMARRFVEEEDAAAQHEGWHFNIEPDATFPLGTDGKIQAPSNLVAFTPRSTDSRNVEVRDGYFYDLVERTDVLTKALRGRLQIALAFEDAPAPFREYVACRAARRLQAQLRGDPIGARDAQAAELMARSNAVRADTMSGRYNTIASEPVDRVLIRTHRRAGYR